MAVISRTWFTWATHISDIKPLRATTSTAVQKTITVAIAILMFAPHGLICSSRRSMYIEPTVHTIVTIIVTG